MPTPHREAVRLSVNLSPEVAETLRNLAESRNTTISNIVRDAIANEQFFYERQQNDEEIFLRRKDGTMTQVIIR